MHYNQYITKKRMKTTAICGQVNIPYGTILSVHGEYITYNEQSLCAVASQNAKDYFWGYDSINPDAEIERQKLAAALLGSAPKDDGDALADPNNPWNRFGSLKQIPGASIWEWNDSVVDMPKFQLEHLLYCVKSGVSP